MFSVMANFVSLLILSVIFHCSKSVEYKYHVTLEPSVFDVYWTVDTASNLKTFYFKFVAKTTGWAAFAWTTSSSRGKDMVDYDIALGGVKHGGPYLNDYWSYAIGKPTRDNTPTQSLVLTNATEQNGFTSIEFNRLANTLDTGTDTELENGTRTYLAWAIAAADAEDENTFNKHNNRGLTAVGYNMFTGEPFDERPSGMPQPSITSQSSVTTQPSVTQRLTTTKAGNIIPSLPVLVLVQLPAMLLFG